MIPSFYFLNKNGDTEAIDNVLTMKLYFQRWTAGTERCHAILQRRIRFGIGRIEEVCSRFENMYLSCSILNPGGEYETRVARDLISHPQEQFAIYGETRRSTCRVDAVNLSAKRQSTGKIKYSRRRKINARVRKRPRGFKQSKALGAILE